MTPRKPKKMTPGELRGALAFKRAPRTQEELRGLRETYARARDIALRLDRDSRFHIPNGLLCLWSLQKASAQIRREQSKFSIQTTGDPR